MHHNPTSPPLTHPVITLTRPVWACHAGDTPKKDALCETPPEEGQTCTKKGRPRWLAFPSRELREATRALQEATHLWAASLTPCDPTNTAET